MNVTKLPLEVCRLLLLKINTLQNTTQSLSVNIAVAVDGDQRYSEPHLPLQPVHQRQCTIIRTTLRTRREFGARCRLVAIPFSSILPWRPQYGTHLERNCFRFHPNPWPRQDDHLSRIYSIYSLP